MIAVVYSGRGQVKEIAFKDYALQWLETSKEANRIRRSTLSHYTGIINKHLNPYFGNWNLSDIRRPTIQKFVVAKSKEGLSPKTVGNILVCLKKMLKDAVVLWEYIGTNPANYVSKPRQGHSETKFLTPAEIKIFLEKNKPMDPTSPAYAEDYLYYSFFSTAVLCGLRRAELLGLKRTDLNFKTGCNSHPADLV